MRSEVRLETGKFLWDEYSSRHWVRSFTGESCAALSWSQRTLHSCLAHPQPSFTGIKGANPYTGIFYPKYPHIGFLVSPLYLNLIRWYKITRLIIMGCIRNDNSSHRLSMGVRYHRSRQPQAYSLFNKKETELLAPSLTTQVRFPELFSPGNRVCLLARHVRRVSYTWDTLLVFRQQFHCNDKIIQSSADWYHNTNVTFDQYGWCRSMIHWNHLERRLSFKR